MLHSRVEESKKINHMGMRMYKSWFICKFSRHSMYKLLLPFRYWRPHQVGSINTLSRNVEKFMKTNKFSRTFDEGARKNVFQKMLQIITRMPKNYFTVGGCEWCMNIKCDFLLRLFSWCANNAACILKSKHSTGTWNWNSLKFNMRK